MLRLLHWISVFTFFTGVTNIGIFRTDCIFRFYKHTVFNIILTISSTYQPLVFWIYFSVSEQKWSVDGTNTFPSRLKDFSSVLSILLKKQTVASNYLIVLKWLNAHDCPNKGQHKLLHTTIQWHHIKLQDTDTVGAVGERVVLRTLQTIRHSRQTWRTLETIHFSRQGHKIPGELSLYCYIGVAGN